MNIAIIPARGGSKRIPRKNLMPFCGKPMLAWSIQAAQASECFERIVVSTDDDEIAETAVALGAEVPFLRPTNLSGDFVGTNQVVVHAISELLKSGRSPDLVACIYATAPFLLPSVIKAAIEALEANPLVLYSATVTEYPFPIQRALASVESGLLRLREPAHATTRSQDLPRFYHDAAQIYVGRPASFRDFPSVFSTDIFPIVLDQSIVQDIDSPSDWVNAERKFQQLRGQENA